MVMGADVVTLGNHSFDNKEALEFIDDERRLIRPYNLRSDAPGAGFVTVKAANGQDVTVINAIGRVFMQTYECPFQAIDTLLSNEDLAPIRFIDFHAEASSEKQAFAWYVCDRATAVVGTHTHVPTADARIIGQRLGYQTDAGMTGPYESVIGKENAIARFTSYKAKSLAVAKRDVWVCGTYVTADADGTCTEIEAVQIRS